MTKKKKKKDWEKKSATLWKLHLDFNLQLIEEIGLRQKKKKAMNSKIKSPPDLVHS